MEKSFKILLNIVCYTAMIIGCFVSIFMLTVLAITLVVLLVTLDFNIAKLAMEDGTTMVVGFVFAVIGTIMFLIVDNE